MGNTKLYLHSVAYYKDYLSQFQSFMTFCKNTTSNNKSFEFISFDYDDGSNFGEILMFGVTHKISFDFVVVKGSQFAILEVVTTHKTCPQDTAIRLARWYFDHLGNVRDSPSERPLAHTFSSTNFLNIFLDVTLTNYFHYIKKLDEESNSSQ